MCVFHGEYAKTPGPESSSSDCKARKAIARAAAARFLRVMSSEGAAVADAEDVAAVAVVADAAAAEDVAAVADAEDVAAVASVADAAAEDGAGASTLHAGQEDCCWYVLPL